MPMPSSMKRSSFAALSTCTRTLAPCASWESTMRSLVMASQPLETTSRMKMSLSEYSHFLMIGMIFCASIDTFP